MPQIDVTINGRQFRMACENGEEARITGLAQDLDVRIGRLRERFGEIGDTRLTVMAALTLADELAELKERMQRMEAEVASLQNAQVAANERAQASESAMSAALHAAAERIEDITKRLRTIAVEPATPMG
jgi:cell division protein ZapA